jgi:hypothetical protein
MGGAHGDVYAVFDYAPDTVLLTKSRGEDAEYNDEEDEEEEESEFQRWPTYSIAESPSRTDNGSAIESSDTDEGENPSVPPPRGRPIGLPKTNTIGTDSILSTSPSNHKRQLQGRQPRLHFDEDRRASASRNEGSADGSAQTEEDGMEGATLQQLYPAPPGMHNTSAKSSGHVPARRQSLSVDTGRAEVEHQEPSWVRGLGEALKRMEERQERIEGMLKMAPGEGD